ncbi:MAG TPA: DUF4236 domain-containing protein [Planosporangium sp.]|jgi:hypothetical protein|nr:DUF4236 domain-containing protein [Planosporangium sp.]
MPVMYRKTIKFGPFRLNIGRNGLSSWSLQIGRWSWNSRTRKQRFDLPGPFSWRSR